MSTPTPPLLTLTEPADPDLAGGKFAGLAAIASHAPVPAAVCVPTTWLLRALDPDQLAQLGALFAETAATLGNQITLMTHRLPAILDGLALQEPMRAMLRRAVADLTAGQPTATLAIRSSAAVEDGTEHSHAGLYATYLNLTGPAVEQAVLACWQSFYAPRAVLGRARAGDLDPTPRMAVIIQRMIQPRLAGVAFTQPDRTIIEATAGTGDALVAGLTQPTTRLEITDSHTPAAPYDQLTQLATDLRTRLGYDLDIEWAHDGTSIHLLQARPVTAHLAPPVTTRPVFTFANLYFDHTLPADLPLGDCAEIYLAYTTKRGPLYRLAHEHRIDTGNGWIAALNGAALADPAHQPRWWTSLTGTVVIDLGATLRQHILPAADLPAFLTDALNLTAQPHTVHTIIIREFIHGDAGIITHRTGEHTIAEYAPQGLLAINRGLADPQRLTLPALNDHTAWAILTVPPGWKPDGLHQLAAFTAELDTIHPGAYAEWVLTRGTPHFIDISIPNTPTPTHATPTNATILSAGTANGPLLVLNDDDELIRLSIAPIISVNFRADAPASPYIEQLLTHISQLPQRPIIHARRPYVILSLLIDHAAGFIFNTGSQLCHLAILLRESHTPALITDQPLTHHAGHPVLLTNGTIHTANPATQTARGTQTTPNQDQAGTGDRRSDHPTGY
jgi:hypothetical protein